MYYSLTIISLIEVVLVLVPALVGIAYVTIAERKTMASMQRRLGPNQIGYLGLLQAFADALKLLLKEYVAPTQANIVLFFLGPVITLIFALLGYAVIPYGPGLTVNDFSLGIYYMLAVSSLATYGILLAGFFLKSFHNFNYGLKLKWISRKTFDKSTWSEGCFFSMLNLISCFSSYSSYLSTCLLIVKHQRSTTKWVYKIIINLFVVFGGFFLFILFLNIIIRHDEAWFYFKFYILHILIEYLFYFYGWRSLAATKGTRFPELLCRSRPSNIKPLYMLSRVSMGIVTQSPRSPEYNMYSKGLAACSAGKYTINSLFFFRHKKSFCSNGLFKFSYSTKAISTLEDKNRESSYLSDEIKSLHTLYIKDLYRDRVAPIIPFDTNLILDTCNDFSDLKERSEFLKKWGSKGGLYLIEYKHNPLIYYIGRTTLFKRRFNNHLSAQTSSKFHIFFNLVGLEYFKFSILEVCSPNEQGIRENFYLQKFLPMLNTTFSSSFSESTIYTSLTDKLMSLKSVTLPIEKKSNQPLSVFVYSLDDNSLNPNYVKYNSMADVVRNEGISYNTLLLFRDTNVPFRNKLYLTKSIIDLESTFNKIKDILKEVKIYDNTAQTVWAYNAQTLKLIKGSPFSSKTLASSELGISRNVINYFIDTAKPEGVKGTYLYSKQLDNKDLQNLLNISESISLGNKLKVWAYEAETFKLINNEPFSSLSAAAKYFNINYRTISRHMDTKVSTYQNNLFIYLFSKEVSLDLKAQLLKDTSKAKFSSYSRIEIWAYKKDEDGKINLLPNQPFKTIREAVRILHMHNTVIKKYIDTNKEYKGLLLYSSRIS